MKYDIQVIKNENLPDSLIDFLNYLETIKSASVNTITGYKADLIVFFRFMMIYTGKVQADLVEFEEIDIRDIDDDFLRKIKLRDLYAFLSFAEKYRSNSSYARARKVATLKSFFNFLQRKTKIIVENPANELESPKLNKRHPVYLTLNQSIHLLDSLNSSDKNYQRDYCILTFFLNCGMRLSELCSIQIEKFKEDTLTIIGKGNKERTVYLNQACLDAIDKYKPYRKEFLDKKSIEQEALIISERGNRIGRRTVQEIIEKQLKAAGLDNKGYSTHKLRHTAATLMYKYGDVDILVLKELLGHANVSTTQIYTHTDDDMLRNAVKLNPLNIKNNED